MRAAIVLAAAVVAGAVSTAGCLRSTTFQCSANTECAEGTCEATGFCSFVDSTCDSGRRYGDYAGDMSGQCVGDQTGPDASDIDGDPNADARVDGGIDAPPGVCPETYVSLPNAPNRYRLITLADDYNAQAVICAGEGAYLVVPDNAAELAAVVGLAGNIWVGVNDRAAEGMWVTQLGDPATYLPWAALQPDDNNPGEDCVAASAAVTYSDERCGQSRAAVCECVP